MIPLIGSHVSDSCLLCIRVSLHVRHRGVPPVTLPLSRQQEIEKQLTLTLTIQADGAVFWTRTVPMETLGEILKTQEPQENKETGGPAPLLTRTFPIRNFTPVLISFARPVSVRCRFKRSEVRRLLLAAALALAFHTCSSA